MMRYVEFLRKLALWFCCYETHYYTGIKKQIQKKHEIQGKGPNSQFLYLL